MSTVLSDIKHLLKKEKAFLFQLVLIQAISIFGILFVAGALINNYMVDRETPYGTLAFSLDFGENKIKCGELKNIVTSMFGKEFNSVVTYASLGINEPNSIGGYDSIYSSFSIIDGKYIVGKTGENVEEDIIWGRFFNDDDFNNGKQTAVTLNYDGDVFVRNGKEYEIIGKRSTEGSGSIGLVEDHMRLFYLPPEAMNEEEIFFCSFGVKRILTSKEKNKIIKAFEDITGGEVNMLYEEENTEEKRAIFKTIFMSGGLIVFALVGTLLIMYIYLFSNRRNRIAVWRLVGCNKNKTYRIFLAELIIIAESSLLIGTLCFYLCRFLILDNTYKYMEVTLTPLNVAVVFALLSLFIVSVCAALSFNAYKISIKELMREGMR
ncbi:MAG: FtsX-like permease family protein [Lachnospiraceae bacterium]|nr:FtsX-like permease family protein [Lachnospiraceae bacterium]